MEADPITHWIDGLILQGGGVSAQRLWESYYERLIRLARGKLGPRNRRIADEEDVALSAFDSFCQRAVAGRFPRLEGRHDLWRILVRITARKAFDYRAYQNRDVRGGGKVRGESAFAGDGSSDGRVGIEQVLGREPTPEFAAHVAEQYERLLQRLGDDSLRDIALMRLENYSVAEIADSLKCSVRTVKRRLAMIREKWAGEFET